MGCNCLRFCGVAIGIVIRFYHVTSTHGVQVIVLHRIRMHLGESLAVLLAFGGFVPHASSKCKISHDRRGKQLIHRLRAEVRLSNILAKDLAIEVCMRGGKRQRLREEVTFRGPHDRTADWKNGLLCVLPCLLHLLHSR